VRTSIIDSRETLVCRLVLLISPLTSRETMILLIVMLFSSRLSFNPLFLFLHYFLFTFHS